MARKGDLIGPIDPHRLMAERRRREDHFPGMNDPAWCMLLGLFVAAEEGQRSTVRDTLACSYAPNTTALRYLGWLREEGLVMRFADANSEPRYFVALTTRGARAMANCLAGPAL